MKGSAIYALSHIQAGEAIKMLMEAARKSSSPDTRAKAVIALVNYFDSTAYSFLKGMSLNGDDASKEAAVRALKLMEEKHGSEPPATTIVTEDVADMLGSVFEEWQMKGVAPVAVEIPGLHGHNPHRKSLTQAISDAVGIKV